jgi:hypothetical protein
MGDELVGFRPVPGEADHNRIVRVAVLKGRKLGRNSLVRRILVGEQYRRAAERISEQGFKGYGVTAGARQLIDVWGPVSIDTDEEAPECHVWLPAQLLQQIRRRSEALAAGPDPLHRLRCERGVMLGDLSLLALKPLGNLGDRLLDIPGRFIGLPRGHRYTDDERVASDLSARRIHRERVSTQVPKAGIAFEPDRLGRQQSRHADRAAVESELIVHSRRESPGHGLWLRP